MKRLLSISIFALFALHSGLAQIQIVSPTVIFLDMQGGIGYGIYRDPGASPLTYKGMELHPGIAVKVERPLWRYEAFFSANGGAYGLALGVRHIQSYGGYPSLGFRISRQLFQSQHGRLWGGVSIDDHFDIRYNGSLGNSCLGAANFARINLHGRAEYRAGRWIFHGAAELNPAALLFRPGYAYIDNFDHDIADAANDQFDQYRWYVGGATGIATELGADFVLPNGNRIGLAYHWEHNTSRHSADGISAPFVFEQASHALLFNLNFKIY